MRCTNCQTVNPEGARFCMNCGQKLGQVCPNCGTELPPEARFCFNCGHQMAPSAPPAAETAEPPGRLHRYMPPELLARLRAARSRSGRAGERRVVTMLFCDVTGSTAAAEKLDPEEWTEIINGAFERMLRPVYDYEGTVARLMGDGILAFFGAPIAHEDDPLRAALAGLEIVEGIDAYSAEVARRWGLPLAVRVGINTGLVVVGEVGSDLRLEYTAIGDAINLAARMEQTAEPGTVQISEETQRRIARYVEVEEVGEITVKGKEEPVRAYRVLRARDSGGAPGRAPGTEAPLAGRMAELAALERAVDELRHGVGRVVALVGEAGLGKSRLVRELQARLGAQPAESARAIAWQAAGTFSFEADQPYSLFQELLRPAAGITQNDEPDVVREKLRALAAATGGEGDEEELALLEALFGLEREEGRRPEGERFKRRLFEWMEAFWRHLAHDGPFLLALDDLQWADPASVELLAHLLPLVEEAPMLVLCVFRPDRHAPVWGLAAALEREMPHRYVEVRLAPLSPSEGGRLAAALSGLADLPAAVSRRIMDLTEGNPFFIEEVVRELVEQGAVARDEGGARWVAGPDLDVFIPDNLQAVLLARLDRLEEDARHTLQLASVIGRRFYYRVLETIAQVEGALDSHLSTLQQEALIREEARIPEREYAFRHALTQEAAYRNILRRQRRDFHRQVGEALLTLYPERRDELAPLLAHHFDRAEDGRALDYYLLAGEQAARLHANVEAADHYARALELARARPDYPADGLADLYRGRGRALEHTGKFEMAQAAYRELEAEGRARGDEALELAGLIERAKLLATATDLHDPEQGQLLLERALAMARALGDRASEARAHWMRLNIHRLSGRAGPARAAGERAVSLSRELAAAPGAADAERELLAYSLHDLAHVHSAAGDMQTSAALLDEASALWRELDNKAMLADSLATSIIGLLSRAAYGEVIAVSDEAYELSRSIGNVWNQSYSRLITGRAYQALGQMARALEVSEEAIRLGDEAGFPMPRIHSAAIITSVLIDLGAFEQARSRMEAIRDNFPAPFSNLKGVVPLLVGSAYLEAGDLEAARKEVGEVKQFVAEYPGTLALDMWRGGVIFAQMAMVEGRALDALGYLVEHEKATQQTDITAFLPLIRYWQARALHALGRDEEARARLEAARAELAARDERNGLWQALALSAELEAAAGNDAAAAAARAQARELIAYIAEHTPAELRPTFLSRPDVAPLLSP